MENDQPRSGQREADPAGEQDRLLADDRFYRTLSAELRRRLLYLLLDERERTVEELATVLVGWEATESGDVRTTADRDGIRIELEHNHLPLLEDAGLVSFDRGTGTVELEPVGPFVTDIVRRSIDSTPPRQS